MTDPNIVNLGPLAPFAGIWEGDKGKDESPDDDRVSIEHNAFRERVVLEPIGLVENHEQSLYGLRYAKTAWRIGAPDSFHEEVGYWLWDAKAKQVMLSAELGSQVFGICSGPFLDEEFQTVRYDIELTANEDGSWSYSEDTQLKIKGQRELFHHTDVNTVRKVP
jgi:hypothetical protein